MASARRREPDEVAHLQVGRSAVLAEQTRCVLVEAARAVDAGKADVRTATTVRSVVRHACEQWQRLTDHALGPAPLVSDTAYAQRHADLHLYLRQEHGPRGLVALGREVLSRWDVG